MTNSPSRFLKTDEQRAQKPVPGEPSMQVVAEPEVEDVQPTVIEPEPEPVTFPVADTVSVIEDAPAVEGQGGSVE